ncbi:MAG TPA: tyrosine-type recombinase/integrase [Kofleriaceae bacterium]|jgi:hypothetical protein|nr:tyrosine-type recombinase/integrase [Kofleriaceae bacterium]
MSVAPLQFLLLVFAGWVNRRQVDILEYLQEENRVLREQLGDRHLRFSDAQRRRLAAKGRAIGRRALEQLAGLVTPDTILRWYRELIAKKYDGTAQREGYRPGMERKVETVDDDRGRLYNHILPALGDVVLAELRPRQIRDFVKALAGKRKLGNRRKDGTRVATEELIAPRTVRHVYATLRAMLNDALADELITTNPCVLKDELPAKVDKDRSWRRTAVFTRDEVQAIISAPADAIPEDRLMLYALEFLGAMRFGEAAALTWRDYDPASSPLGKLVIERSYSSKARRVKETKTDNPREMPVHATLARILAAWKLGGFERVTGCAPRPEDLIVPSRRGRPRNANHALRRFHEDLDRIGLRARRQHDARRTFISIARADGARPDILRWATHGPTGDITDQYTTLPWSALCDEVAKLRIEQLEGQLVRMPLAAAGGGGSGGLGADVVQPRKEAISGENLAERTGLEDAGNAAPRRSTRRISGLAAGIGGDDRIRAQWIAG